jgi:hypothetical protein
MPNYYTPPNRFSEVEKEVAAALAKVAYFISPKIVHRMAELNAACQVTFATEFGALLKCDQFFYEGSCFQVSAGGPAEKKTNSLLENITRCTMLSLMRIGFRAKCGALCVRAESIQAICGGGRDLADSSWPMSFRTSNMSSRVSDHGLQKPLLVSLTAYSHVLRM